MAVDFSHTQNWNEASKLSAKPIVMKSGGLLLLLVVHVVTHASQAAPTHKPPKSSGTYLSKQTIETDRFAKWLAVPQTSPLTQDMGVNGTCPTWTYPTSNATCKCGSSCGGKLTCDQDSLKVVVKGCYCITYDQHQTRLVAGSCFYGCKYYPSYTVPVNVSDVNHAMCTRDKRSGQLCGQCQDGYGPPAYSYLLRCVRCSEGENNVGKYVAIALVPLTIFYAVVALSGFSATIASLNVVILVCHVMVSPAQMRIAESQFEQGTMSNSLFNAYNVVASVYGIWNLDFFRVLYKPFCMHHEMNTLQVLAMDYVIAIYPFVLTVLVYFLVKIYDYKFKVIEWMWRPFHHCLRHFKKCWDIRTSLIDTFATFLLLSCNKLLSVSADLLTYTHVGDVHGNLLGVFLYYDGTITYFSSQHLPYAVLATLITLLFVLVPAILFVLYPCRCFQRVLNICGCRCFVLHTFMDTFQGCYKNGTNGTKDCRYFAGVYFWVRIFMTLMYCLISGPLYYWSGSLILTITIALLIMARPYKNAIFNVTDPLMLFVLMVASVAVLSTATNISNQQYMWVEVVITGAFCTPLLYLLVVAFHRLFVKTGMICYVTSKVRMAMSRELPRVEEDAYPDRLLNTQQYTPLLT